MRLALPFRLLKPNCLPSMFVTKFLEHSEEILDFLKAAALYRLL